MKTFAACSYSVFIILNMYQISCYFGDHEGCYVLDTGRNICFIFNSTTRSFEDSLEYCKLKDGFLIEIHNENIQKLIETFCKEKTIIFEGAWLNLVKSETGGWVWGDRNSKDYVTYSNWVPNITTGKDKVFLTNDHKWSNNYDINLASTMCIKGSRETFFGKNESAKWATMKNIISADNFQKTDFTTTFLRRTTKTTSKENSEYKSTKIEISSTSANLLKTLMSTKSIVPNDEMSANPSSNLGIGLGVGLVVGLLSIIVIIVLVVFLVLKFVYHKNLFKSLRRKVKGNSNESKEDLSQAYDQIVLPEKQTSSTSQPESNYSEVMTTSQDPRLSINSNAGLQYVDISHTTNEVKEPQRYPTPDGFLYTKTLEKKN